MKAAGTFDRDQPWPGWNAGKKLVEKEKHEGDEPEPDTAIRRGDFGSSPRRMPKTAAPKRSPVDPRELPIDGLYRSATQRDRIHEDGAKSYGLSPADVDAYVRECRNAGVPISKSGLRKRAQHHANVTGDKMAALADMDFSKIEERVLAHFVEELGHAVVGTLMHACFPNIDIDDYDAQEELLNKFEQWNAEGRFKHGGIIETPNGSRYHVGHSGIVGGASLSYRADVARGASHDQEIKPGDYIVGTFGLRDCGYNKGPGQWLHPHVTFHKPAAVSKSVEGTPWLKSEDWVSIPFGDTHLADYESPKREGKSDELFRGYGGKLRDYQWQALDAARGQADMTFVKDGVVHQVDFKKAELPTIVFNVKGLEGNAEAMAKMKDSMKKLDERIIRDLMVKGSAKYGITMHGVDPAAAEQLRAYCEQDLKLSAALHKSMIPVMAAEEARRSEHERMARAKMLRVRGHDSVAPCLHAVLREQIGRTEYPSYDATDYEYDEHNDEINIWGTWTDTQGHTMCLDAHCDLSFTLERESIADKEDRSGHGVLAMGDVMDFETYSGQPMTGRWSGGPLPEVMSYGGMQVRKVAQIMDESQWEIVRDECTQLREKYRDAFPEAHELFTSDSVSRHDPGLRYDLSPGGTEYDSLHAHDDEDDLYEGE